MTFDPSDQRRRYLALWFPWLPSERLNRQEVTAGASPERDIPVVMVEKDGGALRLAALDRSAAQAGLEPGLTLADAQARVPALRTVTHRPDLDHELLMRVLEDFGRFSPMIAEDAPNGLVLDVTGCAHLFGGKVGLVETVHQRADRIGLEVRAALTSTPQSARALARFGPGGVFETGQDRKAVRRLPVAALEMSERDTLALRRAGLKCLADLDDRPRAPLAARFGRDFPARLARILGDEDVRITPYRPSPDIAVDRVFFEPVSSEEDIHRVLFDLLMDASDRLGQIGLGGREFEAAFFRVDGEVRRLVLKTGRPTKDAAVVLRLFRERLAALAHPLDPGFGFDQMRLSVLVTQTMAPIQSGLEGDNPVGEELDLLIDRLTARLGPGAVQRFECRRSHMPERAARMVSAASRSNSLQEVWRDPDRADPPLRPLQMFDPPQPVETLAEVPDGSPLRFRWRRILHEVVRSEGPERITGEWWRAPDQRTRDYYRVEDREGRRFWLFRQGLYDESVPPSWFIHGLFA